MIETNKQSKLLKLLSYIIVLATVLSLATIGVSAVDIVNSGKLGDNLTWTLDSEGTLTISGEGKMKNFYNSTINVWYKSINVIIESGVTSIGNNAFYGNKLTSITIPDSVASIGDGAFENCSNLTNITIPDGVTSIGDGAFYGCSSLTSITIPDSVTSIGDGAFEDCSNLEYITVEEGNKYYHISENCLIDSTKKELIRGCKSSIIPSDGSVTSIGRGAFSGCNNVTSLSIPDKVTSIGVHAFRHCSSLEHIVLSKNLINIGRYAFSCCISLKNIDIPDSVTNIGWRDDIDNDDAMHGIAFYDGTFYGCSNLTSIILPNSITTIGSASFMNCSSLTSITIPDSVTSIGGCAFAGCSSLTSITIPDGVTAIEGSYYDDMGTFEGCSSLTSIVIPNSVTSIGIDEFSDCKNLKEIFYGGTERQWNNLKGYNIFRGVEIYYSHPNGHEVVNYICTEGKICNLCNKVLESAKDHTEVIDVAVVPTCTIDGITEGKHCSVCGKVTVKQEVVKALGHTEVVDAAVPATCTTDGVTEGKHCLVCGEVLVKQEVVPASHTEIIYPAVAKTCTSSGLTEGRYCSVCNTVTVKQEIIPAFGHSWSDWQTLREPIETENGLQIRTCSVCGTNETRDIPPLSHTHIYTETTVSPTCTEDGYTIHNCECGNTYNDTYIKALGHDYSKDWTIDKEATETEEGNKSHHCTRCDERVDVTAIPKAVDSSKVFTDVPKDAWFKSAVDYVASYGLMKGVSDTTFEPNSTMNRAMLVTVLYRMEGEPKVNGNTPFTDNEHDWYKNAVAWAYENNIVNGTTETTFAPMDDITREQMATILYRYSEFKGYDVSESANLNTFPDGGDTSNWAVKAMTWAVAEGLISGSNESGKTVLNPRGNATRAQVATILMRFCEKH